MVAAISASITPATAALRRTTREVFFAGSATAGALAAALSAARTRGWSGLRESTSTTSTAPMGGWEAARRWARTSAGVYCG